jgi:CRISPR-associated protein Csd1
MILQALKEYYDRKAADPESGIAPIGWEWKEIHFIIVLDKKGTFLQFEDTREGDGIKKRGKSFLVPQGVKKSVNIVANLLWGPPDYIFGIEDRRGKNKKTAFLDRLKYELSNTDKKASIINFLSSFNLSDLEKTSQWTDIISSKPNLSFRFDGDNQLYCQTEEVKKVITGKIDINNNSGLCLVTGETDKISVLHTAIKGVYGSQTSGANIVSFQKKNGYDSYGKEQGFNAPVGETAMFAYTTALNHLLDHNSSQRMQIGDTLTTVFWSDRRTKFEEDFSSFLVEPPKDDPDMGTRHIKNLFDAPKTGGYFEDSGTEKFFILGLSPNAARLAVRFWLKGTVAEFAGNIRKHFQDIEIVKPKGEPPYYSLWRLLVNTAVQDKNENIPPNITGDFMRAIITGTPYPATLLQAVLRRIKSDTAHRVKPVRAALIKAYLNRQLYAGKYYNEKEVLQVGLDTGQLSIGYHLGRLFAVLEKIQEEANPALNATIRERYYGAACGSPVSVYPTLMRLKNHHLAKLHKGRKTNLEILIGEIMGHFNEFPTHLNLQEQGKFAVGYYHQRQDLFTSKKEDVSNEAL